MAPPGVCVWACSDPHLNIRQEALESRRGQETTQGGWSGGAGGPGVWAGPGAPIPRWGRGHTEGAGRQHFRKSRGM